MIYCLCTALAVTLLRRCGFSNKAHFEFLSKKAKARLHEVIQSTVNVVSALYITNRRNILVVKVSIMSYTGAEENWF